MAVGHILRGAASLIITKETKDKIRDQAIAATVAGTVADAFSKDEEENNTNEEDPKNEPDNSNEDDSSEKNDEEDKTNNDPFDNTDDEDNTSTEFQDREDARREDAKAINEDTEKATGRNLGDTDKIENADSILEGGNQLDELIDRANEQKDQPPKSWREKILEERESQSFYRNEEDELKLERLIGKENKYLNPSEEIKLAELEQYNEDSFDQFTAYDNYDLKFDLDYQRFREEYRQKEIELIEEADFDLAFSEPPIMILGRSEDFDVTDLETGEDGEGSDGSDGGDGGDGGMGGGSGSA